MEEIRIQIIKDILESFGTFGLFYYNIINHLLRGESLVEVLKECCVIYPQEYDKLLSAEANTFGEFADTLTRITTLIRSKQRIYEIYERYCRYFLGELVSYNSLAPYSAETYNHLNLRDDNGFIDYKPYLEALGITDLEHISEQYPSKNR